MSRVSQIAVAFLGAGWLVAAGCSDRPTTTAPSPIASTDALQAKGGNGRGGNGQPDLSGTTTLDCHSPGVCNDGIAVYQHDPDNGVAAEMLMQGGVFRTQVLYSAPQTRGWTINFPNAGWLNGEDFECFNNPDQPEGCYADVAGQSFALQVRDGHNLTMSTNQHLDWTALDGAPVESNFTLFFANPTNNADERWNLVWHERYPGTGRLMVTRTGQCSWSAVTTGDAGLMIFNVRESTGKGKKATPTESWEGRFPLQMSFTFEGDPTADYCQ